MERNRFIDITSEDLDEFTCAICHEVLLQPLFTQCCRTWFCQLCIHEWLANHSTCPVDRHALQCDQLRDPPRALVNLLNRLRVTCDFETQGCSMIIALCDLKGHVQHCEFNPNRTCETCGEVGRVHDCLQSLKAAKEKILEENKRLLKENENLKKSLAKVTNETQNVNFQNSKLVQRYR